MAEPVNDMQPTSALTAGMSVGSEPWSTRAIAVANEKSTTHTTETNAYDVKDEISHSDGRRYRKVAVVRRPLTRAKIIGERAARTSTGGGGGDSSSAETDAGPVQAPKRRVHTPRRYDCQLCSSMFKREQDYVQHSTDVHAQPLPYACTLCERRFDVGSTCRKHVHSHSKHSYR
jgi:hypothetical protein